MQTVRMVTRASPATERPAMRSCSGTPGIAEKLRWSSIRSDAKISDAKKSDAKNLMRGRYLGGTGEAGEPRHLGQCSGPECLFVC